MHAYPHTHNIAELEGEGIEQRADGKYYFINPYEDPDDEGRILIIKS